MKQITIYRSNPVQKSKLFFYIAIGIVAAAAVGIAVIAIYYFTHSTFSGNNPRMDDGKMADDLERLSGETYESVLLSMHSTKYFSEEDIAYYLGKEAVVASHKIRNLKELSKYLDCVFASGNTISNIGICLDPELLWTASVQIDALWSRSLRNELCAYVEAHPDVAFEILLPYPYLSYWLELGEKKLAVLLERYRILTETLYAYPNTEVFFPGTEQWLTVNPANYEEMMFDTNEVISRHLFLLIYGAKMYKVDPKDGAVFWNAFYEMVEREKNAPTSYPDLSKWNIVFFGDSVFANYEGSYSIPGVVSGLSGASVHNFAVGGSSAVGGFSDAFRVFEKADISAEENKLCFIINYGFNDYFNGSLIENPKEAYDETSYTGSLRIYLSKLKERYPKAVYILMTPTHTLYFGNGSEILSEAGGTLPKYVEAMKKVAEETDALFIDNYNDFIITKDNLEEYLADGCHPNEKGRLAIAVKILRFIESLNDKSDSGT